MPVAYFNQRGFCRSKSDSARRGSVGAVSNPSSSQRIALARKNQICGCSSSGRAPPCQGGGSEFEPRQPLQIKGHRCNSVFFFYPQHTRFLHLRKIRGRGPRESLRLLRGVDASSSLVSRSKSKDTDVIRCFSFIRSTLTSSTFIKSEVGVWMRFEPRQPL